MRDFLFFILLAGYLAVLALYATTAAQGRSPFRPPGNCESKLQPVCESSRRTMNTLLICLRAEGRKDECLIAFSPM